MVHDIAMHLYVCTYVCMYVYPSQSIIDSSIDCTIVKMVQMISQSFLWAVKTGVDCKLAMLT